ncbi:MAG: OmpA family protein [Phyllobacteriaceae bacterium]|nr:OmpA family protein [Phyllobacteriaceae bacterium]
MRRFGWILPDVLIAAGATAVAGGLAFAPIAADVASRTAAQLAQEGRGWATVSIDGRDVTLTGVAPEPTDRTLAAESADRVFGVRVVADATTVLPFASPYPFGLERDAAGVKVIGAYPSAATRAEISQRMVRALPGAAVADDTTLARGAPADFAGRADLAATVVADLATGSAMWSGDVLTISGDPRDFAARQAIDRRLAEALPKGASVSTDRLRTPPPPRWSFSATLEDGRVVLDGFLPDEATKARVLAAAKAAFAAGVVDRTVVAPGAAPGTVAAIDFSIEALAKLTQGGAKVDPAGYTIAGRPRTWEIYRDLEQRLHGDAVGGLRIVGDGLVAPAPVPYRVAMRADNGKATVEGWVPDTAAHEALLAALRAGFGTVDDRLELAPGAPKGFVDTLIGLVPSLARLGDLRFELADGAAEVRATAPTAALGERILARIRALLPTGVALKTGDVAVAPPPTQVDAATCQTDLARVQSGEKIHFATGEATLGDDSTRILDALVVAALACRTAHVTVEGHTDSEGDPAANQALSEARARAVVERLVASGIEADRLTAIGYGETRPIADDATPEGRQQNRRIDFRVE